MSFMQSFVAGLAALSSQVQQSATNGESQWGLLPSPNLTVLEPQPLYSDPVETAIAQNYIPDTGVIRPYHFVVTRDVKSPDGFNKNLILVNNQFPGPLLEANWGDTFQITVENQITDEGISIHWHGLTQYNTPFYDGVPGVSQCPIAPGKSYTYRFRADQFGTSWWHSHYSAQYQDGLFGPMVIHGPPSPSLPRYDLDIGPIMLHDYIHESYLKVTEDILDPLPAGPMFFNIDNNLINGKGVWPCNKTTNLPCTANGGFAKFGFQTGKVHRLRLINPGVASNQKFSIEGHQMIIIANDFVPVQPYNASVVTLGPGQRTDILVRGHDNPREITWMHSELDVGCANTTVTNPHGLAAIYYQSASKTAKPPALNIPVWPYDNCANDPLSKTIPLFQSTPPSKPATTQTINITLTFNSSGNFQFFMNGHAFFADYNDPTLHEASANQTTWPAERNVYDFGTNSSVRVILINSAQLNHPMHLHGHNFWVLAEGYGNWDGSIVNPQNPQRRDTHTLKPATYNENSYVVFEWNQDNPGVWPLHCHLAAHVSVGLYINVLEQREKLARDMEIPEAMAQTCTDWDKWTSRNVVDQIDSGV